MIRLIGLVVVLVLVGVAWGRPDVMRARAQRLVRAIEAYHARHHAYPPALQALVPDFLPSIPATLTSDRPGTPSRAPAEVGDYSYIGPREATQEPAFYYVVVSPFGRWCYRFQHHDWNYLD